MSSRCRTTVLLLAAVLLALSLFATPASSATTASKALRFVVVKRTTTYVIVERGSVRVVVKRGSTYVWVRGVRRYRVIRRASTYCLLMPIVSVVSYGAKGDGSSDDTAAIAKTMRAAVSAAKGVYLPAGTYRVSSITVPDGLAVFGAGMTSAWLQGQVVFGSSSTFADLKIGPASAGLSAVRNVDGANATSFTRCHFRGGDGVAEYNRPTVALGHGNDASNLTFTDCEFECALGTTWNTINVNAQGNTIDTVTFDGCHFGVTNGVATGAHRMMIECWTAADAGSWQHNLTFSGCEFEQSVWQNLDLACLPASGRMTGVMIEDCIFHGGGTGGATLGHAIDLEFPADVTIRNNTFYRCSRSVINCDKQAFTDLDTHWNITGNTFDMDSNNGITAAWSIFVLVSANNVVTGNTFNVHSTIAPACVEFNTATATGNVLTGNTFNLNSAQVVAVNEGGASGNTVTPNTVIRP